MINKILIVDDEPLIVDFLKESLTRLNKKVFTAQNGWDAIKQIENQDFDLIITDVKMPKKSGIDVLKFVKDKNKNTIVIVISAFAKIDTAIEALNLGAFNYLVKPFSFDTLKTIIKKAEEQQDLILENTLLKKEISDSSFDIIAKSFYMQDLVNSIEKIATSRSSVFISGESGVGKEVIAKLIHQRSNRDKNPFIKVNLAAISPTLLESEFFGHEKGAFTGADTQKKGRFELANTGTLLLDEITEIPINLQAKLLRVLQEKEFERVGSTTPIKVDIRMISITNQNIETAIKNGTFREDLFYRLNVIPIKIIPLRERKEDILVLANYFLLKFSEENNKPIKMLSKKAQEKLLNYSWPGNVRELANTIERTIVMEKSKIIEKDHILLDTPSNANLKNPQEHIEDSYIGKKISDVEKILILKTLENLKFNRSKAAKILGISTRTLRNKLNLYNLKN
ncbi:MAG: Transcriptional regulatory protein ZraR [Candidatus Anoxychlamydiales bacterium]|nr:Transcriptional regulatory protein ZraR [Candidatus Anoxychlamydiales bacterium]NGX40639.1 Transcriptional regulatory protein ZraR [Candidatus Anoxychlamydiales bacterium]HEU64785.1 sigma-54-dependent Fis family transcriptional regulator [Chlamydiota bacterium]